MTFLAEATSGVLWDQRTLAIAFTMGGLALVLIVWTLASAWRRVRIAEYNAHLKNRMIERGLSADEIERILRAPGGGARGQHAASTALSDT